MCWNLIGWLFFGAVVGWLASVFTGRNSRQGCLMNIFIGVLGAFIGGTLYNLLTKGDFSFGFAFNIASLWGFLVALGGAVVLLLFVNLFTRR
jgi:uncharacterized membrane protein YeaQ/YmgE (transglycosylase-associated protein family)